MSNADDLAPLLAAAPAAGVGFRQGVILAWDPITAQNSVSVGGAVLTDLPILNTAEAGILAAGDVVGLLTTGQGAQSWWILGRLTIPDTPQAGSALSAWAARGKLATADAGFVFDDTTYAVANDSLGPVITDFIVGGSGSALVFISAELSVPGVAVAASSVKQSYMSFSMAGAGTVAADDFRALHVRTSWGTNGTTTIYVRNIINATKMVPLTGLTPGTYSITAKYKVAGTIDAGGASCQYRSLFAVPL